MVSMSSTLVETVSINYEDFNESFLTCGTCLCMYDGNEHTPKLLQCSHTVCLHCLTRIAASQTRDTGTFRCPICRELITIPRGGVSALPPSFLVNQLLDLMSRQRREVIPKCSIHINQELLFCETCDTVFCTLCTGGSHTNGESTSSCEHTIIPFSIAIKRMSEILLYKANECISKLSNAREGVTNELDRLNLAAEKCIEQVNDRFHQIELSLEQRKQQMIASIESACKEKRKILEEQQTLIDVEKSKVEQECEGLQYQVEVRNITQRINSLSEKLDAASSLGEPRENAFLTCDFNHNDAIKQVDNWLWKLGRVRTSTTFPSLCTASLEKHSSDFVVSCGLETTVLLTTVDYHGAPRLTGGDPITADVVPIGNELVPVSTGTSLPVTIVDNDDGTYKIQFRPTRSGRHCIKIHVFERAIKDCPLFFDVTEHNNPVQVYGSHGSGKDEFLQPVAVAVDDAESQVYVVDTGNSRIKVLNKHLEFVRHLENEGLYGRSCTGIAISQNGLVIVNWRTKRVTEMSSATGETLRQFTHADFQEPIDVAVDRTYGHVLVADNGAGCVFVFDSEGKALFQVGKKNTFNLISSVTVSANDEIIVAADSSIKVFSAKGDFLETIFEAKGRCGGITIGTNNSILVSRTEKARNVIDVIGLKNGKLLHTIDSNESRLKRPSGIAVTPDHHVIVVDLGNDSIKKYRYW